MEIVSNLINQVEFLQWIAIFSSKRDISMYQHRINILIKRRYLWNF